MKKVIFYGLQYSGKRSTLEALGKTFQKDVISELWENEITDIKRIVSQNVEILTWLVPYHEKQARKRLFDGATEVYYFISFPSNTELGKEEFERQIYGFPEMIRRAEEVNKGVTDVPWTIVFSKCDRTPDNPYLDKLPKEYLENYICVSARTGEGISKLWQRIVS